MPAKSPPLSSRPDKLLRALGQRLRDHRKLLGISAGATAEAADLSRVTLYRIERGEPSVAMGAYMSVIFALGLDLSLIEQRSPQRKRKTQDRDVSKKIRLSDYRQLKRLAWQLKDTKEISAQEALDLYERNWRHVEVAKMDAREYKFLEDLLAAFGRERLLV